MSDGDFTEGEIEEELFLLDLEEQDVIYQIANDYWYIIHNQ